MLFGFNDLFLVLISYLLETILVLYCFVMVLLTLIYVLGRRRAVSVSGPCSSPHPSICKSSHWSVLYAFTESLFSVWCIEESLSPTQDISSHDFLLDLDLLLRDHLARTDS